MAREIWGLEETPEEGGDDEVLAGSTDTSGPISTTWNTAPCRMKCGRASKTSPPLFYHYGRLPLAHHLAAHWDSTRKSAASSRVSPMISMFRSHMAINVSGRSPSSWDSRARRPSIRKCRLKLLLKNPDEIRGWLAHTEDHSLDLIRDSILAAANKEHCQG